MADLHSHKPEIDPVTGTAVHPVEWDGIRELETPLPRWWVLVYIGSVVFSVAWWVLYPAWPFITGYTKGVLGYSTRAELAMTMAEVKAAQGPMNDRLKAASYQEIEKTPDLLAFATAGGRAIFVENCAQCHGSGAQGNFGYPNLNDDDWLWGGSYAQIEQTIRHGIRAGDPDTRQSMMPAFGKDGLLKRPEIEAVAQYVLSLSGKADQPALVPQGQEVFAANCVACHGDQAQGNQELGAPNLKDAIWLYAGTRSAIIEQVTNPRHGVMPAWAGRLDDLAIKKAVVFVHSLGGGK